ncbi:MAG: hypothetical protein E4G96_00610 [Chrysiogenales bacterium]|nr:MAG: hypothetical protein E4G96_00610 [Chrysiogenales bacterium]
MKEAIYAMLFGLAGTMLFHLGKGMQKHGIGFLRGIGQRVARGAKSDDIITGDIHSGMIYISGILLNNSLVIWIMLANMYAPPSYFASVFGIGIMVLLFYAKLFLDETITKVNYLGMGFLIFGTVTLGMEAVQRNVVSMSGIDFTTLWIIVSAYFVGALCCIRISYKSENPYFIGISFGLFSGGAASLDPVLKGIAQNYGGVPGLFPLTQSGWILFFASFLFATASFLATQWGFVKNAPISVQVSVSSSVYVCFPIMIQGIALPGFSLTPVTYMGMVLVVIGIFCMTGRNGNVSVRYSDRSIIPL